MVSNLQDILALLLAPFLFLLFIFHRRRRTTLNLLPGPPPLPIIGNLHNLRGIPHISLHLLSQKYGPLIQLYIGQIPAIVISNADNASEILKSQDHIFCNRRQMISLKRLSYEGKDIAFSQYDDNWKHLRRLCTEEVFSLNKVQSFEPIRREEVDVLVKTISRASSSGGKSVNLSEILLCFFSNVIFREVFGKRISADGEFASSPVQNMLREVVLLFNEFGAGDLFPSVGWIDLLTGWRGKLDNVFEKMDLFFEEKIKERAQIIKMDGRRERDFLDVLLHLQAKDDAALSTDQIKAILMDMFVAGIDTSAATVEWGMAHLMKNPGALRKVQEEVRSIVGGKEKVEVSDLQHLHYLRLVIKEILRLSPPIPLLPPRESMKDTKINGYDIPAKTMIYVNVWSIGRDPKYWDDPEVFMPERFVNRSTNFKGSYSEFIPFGGGRRICPGLALGMASVELCFANILYGFDWQLPNGMTKEDIDFGAAHGMVSAKKVPLTLVATPALTK